MAAPPDPYWEPLKKVGAAKLDSKKRNHRQNSNLLKETTKRLIVILRKRIPLSDNDQKRASQELDTLKGILSEEDEMDFSIKDAIKAVKDIESKNPWTDKRRNEAIKELKTLKELLSEEDQLDMSIQHAMKAISDVENWVNKTEEKGLPPGVYYRRVLESELNDWQDQPTKMTQKANSGDSTRASETSKSTDKKDVGPSKSTSEETEKAKLYEFYKSEISLLADEMTDGSIDMSAFKQRSKQFPEDNTLMEFQQIRLQLAEKLEKSSIEKSELELLVKEVEKGEYEDSSFANRMKKLKEKSMELESISKIRDSLKKWETENKQMKMFISNLKEHRNDGKFTKISVKGEQQWQEDTQSLIRDLQKLVDGANSKFYDKIKQEVETLQQFVETKSCHQAAVKWYTTLKHEKDAVMRSLGCIAEQNAECETENKQMKMFIASLKEHRNDGKFTKIDVKGKKQWQEDMQSLIHDLQKLVDSANRLSNIAGPKLTENNPGTADLSDPNRPTKLSERYLEIYDNEWTEAYEAMCKSGTMKEQQICLELLNILLEVESECREIAKTQYEQLCSRCTSPAGPGENGQLGSIHLSLINDLQKQTAKLSISSVQKKILKDNKVSMKSEVVNYQKKCVEICWYMSLQTPPMVLDTSLKEGQAFDSERYHLYRFTRKRTYVEFIVWPPLLLHKDGPLLGKGVAQVK